MYFTISLDVIIGFIDSPYSVSENDGNVVLQVGLIEGSLQGQVVVSLSTSDLSAVGKLVSCISRLIAMIADMVMLFNHVTN